MFSAGHKCAGRHTSRHPGEPRGRRRWQRRQQRQQRQRQLQQRQGTQCTLLFRLCWEVRQGHSTAVHPFHGACSGEEATFARRTVHVTLNTTRYSPVPHPSTNIPGNVWSALKDNCCVLRTLPPLRSLPLNGSSMGPSSNTRSSRQSIDHSVPDHLHPGRRSLCHETDYRCFVIYRFTSHFVVLRTHVPYTRASALLGACKHRAARLPQHRRAR